jgi:ssRNA-specific RNase YbeY (16S rRNA maturation enzyme)
MKYELTSNGVVVVSIRESSEEFARTHMDALAETLAVYNVHASLRLVAYDDSGQAEEVAHRTIWERELMPPDIKAATREDSQR